MPIIDYNGPGRWSAESIQQRYRDYARRFRVPAPSELLVPEHAEGSTIRHYPLMDEVIQRAEAGDLACVELAVELVEEDEHMPFGRLLKSNAARALQRCTLSEDQVHRLRHRIVHMLISGNVPREFEEYSRLLRHIGLGDFWPRIARDADRSNPYVERYVRYLERHVVGEATDIS